MTRPDRSARRGLVLLVLTWAILALPLTACDHLHVAGYGAQYDQGTGT